MKILEKLPNNKKYLLLLFVVIGLTFLIPYITLPALVLWWFYKKSNFSRKTKLLITSLVGGLFILLIAWITVSYSRDAEPRLALNEPSGNVTVKTQEITLKGTYGPSDRKVWVNGKQISAENGKFETTYQLKVGENKIEISAGNWRRTRINLIVTRELTEEEKAKLEEERKAKEEKEIAEKTVEEGQRRKEEATKKDTPTPSPRIISETPEQMIEAKIRAVMKGKTNTDKDKIREIRITEQVDGGYGVLVYFNASDNITDELIKKGIWKDMSTIYKALFEEDIGVKRTILFAHFDMTDKYGNVSDTMVLKTSLEKSEAEKVNWNADEATLYLSILPNVWTTEKSLIK